MAIIGHNGAGKSTILKLICRVTAPTKGNIYLNGRITSMLEVGTGFHGELTGRENIFMNGAILGMTKAEVAKKYEQIVDFSEVGQFIETPTKRYSSGMSIKLGFAVASHLDSEIMIMDEVLAVGDVNFQNKCINRMKEVAEDEGKTILYVSHNMATVKSLCTRCIVLSHGKVVYDGDVEGGIAVYMNNNESDTATFKDLSELPRHRKCNQRNKLQSCEILERETSAIHYGEKFPFRLSWNSENDNERLLCKLIINGIDATPVGVCFAGELKHSTGFNQKEFTFDSSYLVPGKYAIDVILYDEDESGNVMFYDRCKAMQLSVEHSDDSKKLVHWFKDWGNAVLPCVEQK